MCTRETFKYNSNLCFLKVTGKFHGGVNPFTRGCCNNLEYLVCSPISPQ